MKFTGERYIPDTPGHLTTKYEHMHRYAVSLPFLDGKDVLDIASGEGYGSALLARQAQSVTGVDIDPESVEHASRQYRDLANLRFACGSCAAIPLEAACVDVVTSFETIEHHDRHEEMMAEIKRVLRPNGLLILSSPNRQVYTEEMGNVNEHHVKELYYDELCDLLSRHFSCVRIYGQRLAAASFISPLASAEGQTRQLVLDHEGGLSGEVNVLRSPVYYVALCSDDPDQVRTPLSSVYFDQAEDLWAAREQSLQETLGHQSHLSRELEKAQAALSSVQSSRFWKMRTAWLRMTGRG